MAADTYDTVLGLLLQGTGNNNNTWGALNNTGVIELIARAIAGRNANTGLTGGTLNLDDVVPPAGPTEALDMIQYFSGTLSSDQVVEVPNISKMWMVHNALTLGAYTLKFKTTSGSASTAIPVGFSWVFCDGSDGIFVGLSTSLRDTQWLGADGTLAAPGLSFSSEPGSGLRRKSAGVLSFSILGVEIFTISSAGITFASGDLIGASGLPTTGDVKFTLKTTADTGWVMFDDGTIGNGSSGATTRANADCSALFTLIWNNISNTYAPIYNSDGSVSTRGASAAADFAANKRIALTKMLGRALAVAGNGSGLTARALGETAGEETVVLDTTMIPAHTHANTAAASPHQHFIAHSSVGGVGSSASTYFTTQSNDGGSALYYTAHTGSVANVLLTSPTTETITMTNASAGGGLAHPNMQPTSFLNAMVKL